MYIISDIPSIFKTPIVDINNVLNYIVSNVNPSRIVLTVYTIIIGSKTDSIALETTDLDWKRNHECPKFVENLFVNPSLQFSPEFCHYLSDNAEHSEITIRQVLLLIDPLYARKNELKGLDFVISKLDKEMGVSSVADLKSELVIKHKLHHNEYRTTTITSILEPVVVPCDITQKQVLSLIKTIKGLSAFYPVLCNIMDCSSNTIPNIFYDSIDSVNPLNLIHITYPKCLLIDTQLQYLPIITLYKKEICDGSELCDSYGSCGSDGSADSDDVELVFKKTLSIRWINYHNDSKLVSDLLSVSDYCPYSKRTYDFIATLYKINTIEYSLVSLYKLWGITTYTINYKFNYNRIFNYDRIEGGRESGCDGRNSIENEMLINFKDLSFEEFARYWKLYKGFRDLQPFNYGYDIEILNKFITNFINKYNDREGYSYLGINPSIIDFLKLEAFDIFNTLAHYFPKGC